MALATRTIDGNNSGALPRRPEVVILHATRSTIATKTDVEELGSTLNWFVNPAGASAHWVLSETERVRVVADELLAGHAGYLNDKAWGVEMTQPTIDRPFTEGHYANAALIGRHYVSLGVAPVWLSYWDGGGASGFVGHEDTVQGRASGKSDPGPEFDRQRFIASLTDKEQEDDDMYVIITDTSHPGDKYMFVDGAWKKHLTPAALKVLTMGEGLPRVERRLSDAEFAQIPDYPQGGGAGITPAQAVTAAKKALKEGGG